MISKWSKYTVFYITVCLLLLLCIQGAEAKQIPVDFSIAELPAWVEAVDFPDPAKTAKKRASVNYVLVDFQNRVSKDNVMRFSRYVAQPLNSDGVESMGNISIDFNPDYETLTIHSVQIIRDNKTTSHLKREKVKLIQQEEELNKKLYNGTYKALLFVEDLRVGDLLEWSYTIAGNNPAFEDKFMGSYYLQWGVDVETYRMRYSIDNDMDFNWKSSDNNFQWQEGSSEGGFDEYVFVKQNIKPSIYEDNMPASYLGVDYLDVSNFSDWEEVIAWANPLYRDKLNASEGIKAKAKEIKAANISRMAQVSAAIQFVQDEVRYLGIELGAGAYEPFEAQQTFERRFGDCKDKSVLLVSLLNELGIESHPVLVHSYLGEQLPDVLPSAYQFNHVIAKIKLPTGKTLWVDPTVNNQGFIFNNDEYVQYHYGLPLLDSAVDGLEPIAFEKTRKIVFNDYYELSVDKSQPVKYTVESIYMGSAANDMRSSINNQSDSDLLDNFLDFYSRYYEGIEETQDLEVIDDREQNKVTIKESYLLSDFWIEDDEQIYASFIAASLRSYLYEPEKNRRKTPYYLGMVDVEHNIQVKIPGRWDIEKEDVHIDNDFFDYEKTVRFDRLKKIIHLKHRISVDKDQVPTDAYKSYKKDIDKAVDQLFYYITKDKPSGS